MEVAVQPRRPQGATPAETGVRVRWGNPRHESFGVDTQEKLCGEVTGRPYRKPTQVGKASSLR